MNLMKLKIYSVAGLIVLTTLGVNSQVLAQQIVFSPDTLYMGKITTNSLSVREQRAFNVNATTLEITSIAIENDPSGSFHILDNPGSVNLGITRKVILDIEFKPTQTGSLQADLIYTSNSTNSQTTVHLYGEGMSGSENYFERVFGPSDGGSLSGIHQTTDGGYFMSGSTPNLDEEVSDIYMVQTDASGKRVWEGRIEDEDYNESAGRLIPLPNDEYLLFGSRSKDGSSNTDMQLMKIDANREKVWSKRYGGDDIDNSADILKVDDGYLLLGSSDSYSQSSRKNKDIYLVKVDDNGVEQWAKTYGGDGGESAESIIAVSDGGYLILAESTSWVTTDQDQDLYLVKVDAAGNLIWDKIIDGVGREGAAELAELPGGGFAVVGYSASGGAGARDMYLVTVDASGNQVWERYFGEPYTDRASYLLIADDGILVAGSIQVRYVQSGTDTFRYSDLFLIKTDFEGNHRWTRQYGGDKSEGCNKLLFNKDGDIVILGGTSSYYTNSKVFFLTVSPNGDFVSVEDDDGISTPSEFQLHDNYPNPFNSSTVITYDLNQDSRVQINLYNLRGQKIGTLLEAEQKRGRHSIGFDAEDLSSGIYFYELKTILGVEAKEMLLIK